MHDIQWSDIKFMQPATLLRFSQWMYIEENGQLTEDIKRQYLSIHWWLRLYIINGNKVVCLGIQYKFRVRIRQIINSLKIYIDSGIYIIYLKSVIVKIICCLDQIVTIIFLKCKYIIVFN